MKLPNGHILPRSTSTNPIDRANTIRAASWVILIITTIVFGARQIMKVVVFRRMTLDDLLILVAFSFAVSLSIIALVLSFEGLGTVGPLTLDQTIFLMKGYYSSEIVYIVAIGFAKLSILVIFYNVVVTQRIIRRAVIAFGAVLSVWTVASLIAIAFQCELPQPWQIVGPRCSNSRIFWIVYCMIDIFTEVAIIMLSVHLVVNLQVRLSRKLAVIACFVPRVLVLSVAIVRLVLLYPATLHGDPQYRLWVPAIISQAHVCLSIATASIPYMVPFFKGMDGDLRRTHSTKSRLHLIDEETGRSRSSLWFRRHNKTKALELWDPTADAVVPYNRVPQLSPYIPAPRPLSPLSPPRPQTPLGKQASVRGLNIYIPCRDPRRQRSLDW
ncbi:hypothetical protein BKA58DRAFT_320778, partial [Alternaria rosae]|uniref:uncharacterized protein n=1 Tax=Alternaria rosae TaxID=1187941 RepID=UPI001E8E0604